MSGKTRNPNDEEAGETRLELMMVVGEWKAVTSLSSVERPPSARAHITSAPSNVSLPRKRMDCVSAKMEPARARYGELTNVCHFLSGMPNKQRILKILRTFKVPISLSFGSFCKF